MDIHYRDTKDSTHWRQGKVIQWFTIGEHMHALVKPKEHAQLVIVELINIEVRDQVAEPKASTNALAAT